MKSTGPASPAPSMPKRQPNLNRKLAHTLKRTGGPAAQLDTLADAAQLIADLEQWRQARPWDSLRGVSFARRQDRTEGRCCRSNPVRPCRAGERELAEKGDDREC